MIRVLLAEDEHLIRGALLALIRLNDDMEIVAEIADGQEIVPAARRERPRAVPPGWDPAHPARPSTTQTVAMRAN